MLIKAWSWLWVFVWVAGCATVSPPPLRPQHPASPEAAEAPVDQLSDTLADKDAGAAQLPTDDATFGGMSGMSGSQSNQPAATQAAASYTCPMHPQVESDKPGNCPICGMKLVLRTTTGGQP